MDVFFWIGNNGQNPVAEYLENLPPKHKNKLLKILEYFEERGLLLLNSKFLKKLQGYNSLYEVRLHFDGIYYRILCTINGQQCFLLHVFEKKGDSTPINEINVALKRAQSIKYETARI